MIMNAVPYIRLSNEDQSSYSIENQLREITAYCQKHNLQACQPFIDNGESSYTFDRADFKRLETYVKKNRPRYIIVYHLDRFSRNLAEALQKIRELLTRYNVRVRDITEPLDLDDTDPNVFLIRSFRFMMAEGELHRIRQRIKAGMTQGAINGRHLNMAPYGYTNSRDEQNKPILVINEEKALHVQVIFKQYLAGHTVENTRRIAAAIGYTQTSNSAVQRILKNPVYMGKIKVPGSNKLVPGLHRPIISENDFYRVQERLAGRKAIVHQANEDVFLRGVLKDHTGNLFTAGNSRGKSGRYYWYYVSRKTGLNLPANRLHAEFYSLLASLQLSDQDSIWISDKVRQNLQQKHSTQESIRKKLAAKLSDLQKRIETTEEKYLLQPDISQATYTRVMANLQREYGTIQQSMIDNRITLPMMLEKLQALLPLLTNLGDLFKALPLHKRQQFVRTVFDNSLAYYNDCYRTPYLHPIFSGKAALLKEKRLLIVEQPVVNLGNIPVGTPSGNTIENFDALLSALVA